MKTAKPDPGQRAKCAGSNNRTRNRRPPTRRDQLVTGRPPPTRSSQTIARFHGITALGGRVTANAVHGNQTGIPVVRATEVRRNDVQNNGTGILVGTFAAGTVARSNDIQGNGGHRPGFVAA